MRKLPIPKEYLGAFKAGHRPSARAFIDDELSYQLLEKITENGCQESKELLEFITKFNNEYYKGTAKKGDPNALHKSDVMRRECYKRNYRQSVDCSWRASVPLTKNILGF